MKSVNVITEYTNFIKRSLTKISKLMLGKNYSDEDFSKLLDVYVKARYYDSLDRKSKSPYFNTKSYVKEELSNLEKKSNISAPVLNIYNEVLSLEQSNYNSKEFLNNTLEDREKLRLSSEKPLEEVASICDEINKKRREIQKAFSCKDFFCDYKATNFYKVFIVNLDYSFSIPKLYSDFAINKVYTSGVVNEDKLFVEYHLITCKLFNEILSFDFSNNYIIEFACSLLDKENKLSKLFSIIDNDICKEKLCLKITSSEFEQYKDKILDFINEGYNFAIKIDDEYVDSLEKRKLITSIFKYVIINSGNKNMSVFEECSNLIKVK